MSRMQQTSRCWEATSDTGRSACTTSTALPLPRWAVSSLPAIPRTIPLHLVVLTTSTPCPVSASKCPSRTFSLRSPRLPGLYEISLKYIEINKKNHSQISIWTDGRHENSKSHLSDVYTPEAYVIIKHP